MTKYNKTFAALIVSGIVPIVTYLFGFDVSPEIQAVAVTALTTLFVFLIPNKPATP